MAVAPAAGLLEFTHGAVPDQFPHPLEVVVGVALGSDMDGGFGAEQLPQELDHPEKLDRLAEALRKSGWSDEEVRGFASENWLRLLRSALPT